MRHPLALALLALAAGTLEAQPGLASFEPIGGPEGAFTYALFVEPDGDVLAGSYDGYASAYRSRDGGASWAYVEALPNGRYHAFVEAPSGDLFALTSSDVVRSSDGGDTWTRAPGSSAISGLNDLVVTAGGALLVSSSCHPLRIFAIPSLCPLRVLLVSSLCTPCVLSSLCCRSSSS